MVSNMTLHPPPPPNHTLSNFHKNWHLRIIFYAVVLTSTTHEYFPSRETCNFIYCQTFITFSDIFWRRNIKNLLASFHFFAKMFKANIYSYPVRKKERKNINFYLSLPASSHTNPVTPSPWPPPWNLIPIQLVWAVAGRELRADIGERNVPDRLCYVLWVLTKFILYVVSRQLKLTAGCSWITVGRMSGTIRA